MAAFSYLIYLLGLPRGALGADTLVEDHDLDPSILLAPRRRVVCDGRVLRAVALGGDPVGGDASRRERVPDRVGALLRELEVEVLRSRIVGVPLDQQVAL